MEPHDDTRKGASWCRWWVALLVLASGLVLPSSAVAIDLEKLVMPGPLISAHAEYEDDCSSCHRAFDSGAERTLCIDCHDEIRDDFVKKRGLHGLLPAARDGECRSCHPDHRGRDADVLETALQRFDHAFTDYPLRGAHAAVACADCHEVDVPRRETPGDCASCHADVDAHGGALGNDCGDCHEETAWRDARFDHAKETEFVLEGAHGDVECQLCHVGGRYEATPTDCISCHRLDDSHEGRFGPDCGRCHTPERWRRDSFDHEAKSGFALLGAHAKTRCESCHVEPPGTVELDRECASCHAVDDVHRGAHGSDCGDCHGNVAWTGVRFDHHARTDFALNDAHADLACRECHTAPLGEEEMDSTCYGCHASDDVHAGQQGQDCGSCHGEKEWSLGITFDHEVTRFPLLGLHPTVTCEECHTSARFRDTPSDCVSCHENSDVHEQRLGVDCALCHNPNDWALWRFDHDAQTRFELHGRHEGLACESCHTQAATGDRVRAPRDCKGCHHRDDAHRGSFGRDCGLCHEPAGWDRVRIGSQRGGGS